jgi:hypothetical protein
MNLEQATRWRNLIGKGCALLCAFFLLAALDGIISHFRQPANLVELLPGASADINGSVAGNLASVQELDYVSNSGLIQVSFEAVHAGFWMGGQMWRGKLMVSPEIEPGEYALSVDRKGHAGTKPASVFRVKIYPDRETLRKNSPSFARRFLDLSPWWIFAAFLPAALLAFVAVYMLSHKRDEIMAMEGKAEIYYINQSPGEYEVSFGLGRKHGIQEGDRLVVLDEHGRPVGKVEVRDVMDADSTAIAGLDCPIKRGYAISRE